MTKMIGNGIHHFIVVVVVITIVVIPIFNVLFFTFFNNGSLWIPEWPSGRTQNGRIDAIDNEAINGRAKVTDLDKANSTIAQ